MEDSLQSTLTVLLSHTNPNPAVFLWIVLLLPGSDGSGKFFSFYITVSNFLKLECNIVSHLQKYMGPPS